MLLDRQPHRRVWSIIDHEHALVIGIVEARDRVERRAESYMKDFKPMKLGAFDLKAGRGELALRAMQVAGKQVMDVRYVVLNRVE